MRPQLWLLFLAVCCLPAQAQYTLDECQQLARQNYPLIRQYGLIEKSAAYSAANAAKAMLPQVSLVMQATYQNDVAAFPDEMNAVYEQLGIEMKGLSKDQYRAALEVNQTIWDGGLTRVRKELAAAEGMVAAQSVETELYALRERINQLYFGLLTLNEQVCLNELLQKLLQSNYQRVEACIENGVALPGDLLAVKAELLSIAQQGVRLASAAEAYRRMLAAMTGESMDEGATFEKPAAGGTDGDGVSGRPELLLFEAREAQFEVQARAIRASTMPRLGFFAQGFYGNPGLNLFKDMTEDRWSWNYIAGLRLQWNFGAFYTKKGSLQKLSLAGRQVANQRETFLFNNRLQQIRQHSAIAEMRQVMTDDDEIIRLRTAIRIASEAKYASGTVTLHEVLRDITTENQAMRNKSLHELEWLKNIYDLRFTVNRK
jgi:outer membrane protein TolC